MDTELVRVAHQEGPEDGGEEGEAGSKGDHSPPSNGSSRPSQPKPAAAVKDPVSEGYRSIIDVINRTSNGFKEGKKWKCVADTYSSSSSCINSTRYHHHHHHNQQQQRRRKQMMSHSRTVDESYLGHGGDSSIDLTEQQVPLGGYDDTLRQQQEKCRGRKLVRQKATTSHLDDSSDEPLLSSAASVSAGGDERTRASTLSPTGLLRPNRHGLPPRQWTVDTCTGIRAPLQLQLQEGAASSTATMATSSTAYMLRPVSRSSADLGQQQQQHARRLSPAERSLLASSYNRSLDSGGDSSGGGGGGSRGVPRLYEKLHLQQQQRQYVPQQLARRHHLIKQRTCDSAPTAANQPQHQAAAPFGGSSRCLPRQHSNASAYSAASCNYYSGGGHATGITLVRGASCSLVDIPTYLGPGGVELVQLCEPSGLPPTATAVDSFPGVLDQRKVVRPRLQLDLTKKNAKPSKSKKNGPETAAEAAAKSSARKTHLTVLCVSVTLLTLSVTLVGTMLSVGSQYQEMVIAKQRDTLTKNHSRSKAAAAAAAAAAVTTEEPLFVIVPDDIVLTPVDDAAGSGSSAADSGDEYEESGSGDETNDADGSPDSSSSSSNSSSSSSTRERGVVVVQDGSVLTL